MRIATIAPVTPAMPSVAPRLEAAVPPSKAVTVGAQAFAYAAHRLNTGLAGIDEQNWAKTAAMLGGASAMFSIALTSVIANRPNDLALQAAVAAAKKGAHALGVIVSGSDELPPVEQMRAAMNGWIEIARIGRETLIPGIPPA